MLSHIAREIEIVELGEVGKGFVHFSEFVSVKMNGSGNFVLVGRASLYIGDCFPWYVNDL